MNQFLDTAELDQILAKLELIDDEVYAANLLSKFNNKSKVLGQLLLNKDSKLDHLKWKQLCAAAKKELDLVLKEILEYKNE